MKHTESSSKVFTEEILPRDFGVIEQLEGDQFSFSPGVFRTPTADARALFLLASPEEKKNIIAATAQALNEPLSELELLLRRAMTRAHGRNNNILALGGRDVLRNVVVYNSVVQGEVRSHGGDEWYEVSITLRNTPDGPRIISSRAQTKGDIKEDTKTASGRNYLSTTIAVLANALYLDAEKSTPNTVTGLQPRYRVEVPGTPFHHLNIKEDPAALGKVIVDYYVNDDNQYGASVAHLASSGVSRRLLNDVHSDHANFVVARQRESKRSLNDLDARLLASIRATNKATKKWAENSGYHPVSGREYVREFVGTGFETVAQRYENGPWILHLVAGAVRARPDGESDFMPPLVVARQLLDSSLDSSSLPIDFNPFSEEARNKYDCVDDATRRQARSIVLVPSVRQDVVRLNPPQPTSKLLREAYQKWLP